MPPPYCTMPPPGALLSAILMLFPLLFSCGSASSVHPLPSQASPPPAAHPAESIFGYWDAEPTFDPATTGGAHDGPLLGHSRSSAAEAQQLLHASRVAVTDSVVLLLPSLCLTRAAGNGDLGAAVSSQAGSNRVTFNLGLNQFWSLNATDSSDHAEARLRAPGGVSLSFLPSQPALAFTAHQFLHNASVRIELSSNSSRHSITATIDAVSNSLILSVLSTDRPMRLNVTTFTYGPYGNRRGYVPPEHFVTRSAFHPNASFPISMALVTKLHGEFKVINNSDTSLSASTVVVSTATSASPLLISALILTNLDAARVNFTDTAPTDPVVGADPLPAALAASAALNATVLQADMRRTVRDWAQFWSSTTVVQLSHPGLMRFWYGAQYLLRSCSRYGKVSPGLWGNQIVNDQMNWNGDYTLNYNYQSPWYGSYSSNQLDLAASSYIPLLQYRDRGRLNAQSLGCLTEQCVHYPVHIAAYGQSGVGGPYQDWRQHFIATFSWLNLITHCDYTDDRQWCLLAYDCMKGAVQWWQHYLVKQYDAAGTHYRYVDADDCTNEGCDGEKKFNGVIPLAMIRRSFQFVLRTSLRYDIDRQDRAAWIDVLQHLSALPLTHALPPFDNLTIFGLAEDNTTDSTPRPDSNPEAVFPIWPVALVSQHSPRNLTAVALNTIAVYTGGWTQANAVSTFMPAAVRIGYPASRVMDGWQQRLSACLLSNLWCSQGGGGIESSGAVMAVNEQLMQNSEFAIQLFPVWPAELNAAFYRMRARGGVLVSAEYSNRSGTISGVELQCESAQCSMRVMHPWQWSLRQQAARAEARWRQDEVDGRCGDVADMVVVRRLTDGTEARVDVRRYERPPAASFAGDVEYEQGECVVWYEWEGCKGCQYALREGEQQQQLNQHASTVAVKET